MAHVTPQARWKEPPLRTPVRRNTMRKRPGSVYRFTYAFGIAAQRADENISPLTLLEVINGGWHSANERTGAEFLLIDQKAQENCVNGNVEDLEEACGNDICNDDHNLQHKQCLMKIHTAKNLQAATRCFLLVCQY